jgi:hypothetical protein
MRYDEPVCIEVANTGKLQVLQSRMIVADAIRLIEQDEADDKNEEDQLQGSCESSPPPSKRTRMYFPSNTDTSQKTPNYLL